MMKTSMKNKNLKKRFMKKIAKLLNKQEPPHESIKEEEDLDEAHHDHDDHLIEEIILIHEDKGMVSCTPLQDFDLCDASFDDLESEEFSEKTLNLVNFSIDEEHEDHIDDFLHIGRR